MKLKDNGETIVEVMIGIAVVASVLSSAYYLLNRSYRQSQAAIERVAALKAAESKVETLRTFTQEGYAKISTGNQYCISSSDNTQTVPPVQANCIVDRYNVFVTKDAYGAGPNAVETYKITSEWDSILGGKETLTIYYRP